MLHLQVRVFPADGASACKTFFPNMSVLFFLPRGQVIRVCWPPRQQVLVISLVSKGGPERILGHSGLDPERLACPTQSLSLIHYCQAMETAAEQLGQDNFGLHYGYQFQPQSLGLLGYIGLCSATVEQALINLVHAFPYHQHDTLTRLVDQGNSWRLDYQVRHGGILCRRQDAETDTGHVFKSAAHRLGPQWAPKEVYFEHPRPENWHEHCKLFDAPVYFDQPYNALVIPKASYSARCRITTRLFCW
ncbi:AraC family transcriptional regulator [Halopseudomonas pachastrellae]|nr:AraC family transcriptional regulator [Halopseudomonas pachastrellae]